MKKLSILLLLGGILLLAIKYYFATHSLPNSLIGQSPEVTNQRKYIVGFLPYWQMSEVPNIRFDLLDEVIYFGFFITESGEISGKDTQEGSTQGYRIFKSASFQNLQTKLTTTQTRLSLALVMQDTNAIKTFLANPSSQQRLFETTSDILATSPTSGINLDFEYAGIPDKEMVSEYSTFVQNFQTQLKKSYPKSSVSVDISFDAMQRKRLYDVEKLGQVSNRVIIMGYDFYKSSSSVAGPGSPLFGKEEYDYDLSTAITDVKTVVPKEKIIVGLPNYGWDYPTQTEARGSSVELRDNESVALSTYKRTKTLLSRATTTHIDQASQTPWLTYRDPDTNGIRQVWYEDAASLGKKYDEIIRQGVSGVAIWALGYDGDSPDLWNVLSQKLR